MRPMMRAMLILNYSEIRSRLQSANLSQLSRDTGLDVRTLRRMKNGQTPDIMASTAELLTRHLPADTQPRKKK